MLLRHDAEGVIAIPQPSHAWMSGQMARLWGNGRFDAPHPFADVCLAAELHDIGWFSWELAPTVHPESGYPQTFPQVPSTVHVRLWREGVARARLFGRYAALLVSLHADTIYSRYFDFATASEANAAAVRDFLAEQHAFQASMRASLAGDPLYAAEATAERIETNRLMVAALDWLSLQVCWGVDTEIRVPQVPSIGTERIDLVVRPGKAAGHIVVDPWPFATPSVALRADGLRLARRSSSDEDLRAILAEAIPVSVTAQLESPRDWIA